jgi:hypothetical protein
MSAFHPIADLTTDALGGRLCAMSGCEQSQQTARLFDHLVGQQLQRVGHLDAQRSGRLQVDDKLEFCGLQDRQVGGLGALEDLTGVDADLLPTVQKGGPIAHQPAHFDELAEMVGRGNPMRRRERRKLDAPVAEEPIGSDEEGVGPVGARG